MSILLSDAKAAAEYLHRSACSVQATLKRITLKIYRTLIYMTDLSTPVNTSYENRWLIGDNFFWISITLFLTSWFKCALSFVLWPLSQIVSIAILSPTSARFAACIVPAIVMLHLSNAGEQKQIGLNYKQRQMIGLTLSILGASLTTCYCTGVIWDLPFNVLPVWVAPAIIGGCLSSHFFMEVIARGNRLIVIGVPMIVIVIADILYSMLRNEHAFQPSHVIHSMTMLIVNYTFMQCRLRDRYIVPKNNIYQNLKWPVFYQQLISWSTYFIETAIYIHEEMEMPPEPPGFQNKGYYDTVASGQISANLYNY